MKVLGINGSGRAGGNTAVLVRAFLEGAREGGAETEFVELAGWDLAGCKACGACKAEQRCAIDDDMARFHAAAADVDVLFLGTPIYLDHVTAQMMAFIQRLYCYIGPGLENLYPNRSARAALGITYGAGGTQAYQYVLDWMTARLKGYFGIETIAAIAIHSTSHTPNVAPDHPQVQRARQAGRDCVE